MVLIGVSVYTWIYISFSITTSTLEIDAVILMYNAIFWGDSEEFWSQVNGLKSLQNSLWKMQKAICGIAKMYEPLNYIFSN